ncbi:MAG: hypothetical protein WBQ95_00505 [Terracidiphilus sp.]
MPTDASLSQLHEPAVAATVAGPAVSANEVAEVSLLDILIILAERKRLILWITGAFAVIAIVTSL